MQKLWKKLRNLVQRYVPGVRKSRKKGLIIFDGEEFRLQQIDPKEGAESSESEGITPLQLYTYLQEEWQERDDKTVLPIYVCGVDPYESGESEIYCWPLGGEHSPYFTKGELSQPGDREIEYPDPHMGGTHPVRRATHDPSIFDTTERDAELLGDSATAFLLALQLNERRRKALEGTEETPGE